MYSIGNKTMSNFLANALQNSNGKFVTVSFIKNNGNKRILNGRLGVVKHLKGGKSTVDTANYINIYDIKTGGYRNVSRDSIVALAIEGVNVVNKQHIA
jgi:phage/plasmid primase-like uncharacterized protein